MQFPFLLSYCLFYPLLACLVMQLECWWVMHVCFFNLEFLGGFDTFFPSSATLVQYESAGILAWIVKRANFVPAQGSVQLPMPGGFPDQAFNPREPTRTEQGSFMTRLTNAFSKDKYVAIGEQDVDPLLWDDHDHDDQVAQQVLSESPTRRDNI